MDEITGDNIIVLGSTWTDDGCLLRCRAPGQTSHLVPAVGLTFNFRASVDSPRHCLGHHSVAKRSGRYQDCDRPPQAGERSCVACAVADAELAGDLHHAHRRSRDQIDETVIDHLSQANVLYLAAFRDGSMKVGTSTEPRQTKRLIEQGAWLASVVATTSDGFTVRRIEDLVTAKLDVPQSVSIKRKLRGMANPLGNDRLATRLDNLVAQVHEVLRDVVNDSTPNERTVTLQNDRWSFPGSDDPIWAKLLAYPARLDRGNHHIELVEMCGRVAVIRRLNGSRSATPGSVSDQFVVDIGQLFGIELDIGPHTPDELAIQRSLF